MKPFTIIIPTMWLHTDMLNQMIQKYIECPFVEVVKVISNAPMPKNYIPRDFRVEILTEGRNLYVNPSWNKGVADSSTESVVLANDDIFINNLDALLAIIDLSLSHGQIIGMDSSCFKYTYKANGHVISIVPGPQRMEYGFGVFMAIKRKSYVPIPEQFKVWYGDKIMYINNTPRVVKNVRVITKMRGTSATMDLSRERKSERQAFLKYLDGRR